MTTCEADLLDMVIHSLSAKTFAISVVEQFLSDSPGQTGLDKLWHLGRADDGGFIQEFTRWNPAPLQQTLHLTTVVEAIG